MLQGGDTERFPQALGLESLDPFLRVSKQGPCLTAIEEGGGNTKLGQVELACEVNAATSPDPAVAVVAEGILMRISAEQVPFLHRGYLKLVTSSNFLPFMLISALM